MSREQASPESESLKATIERMERKYEELKAANETDSQEGRAIQIVLRAWRRKLSQTEATC